MLFLSNKPWTQHPRTVHFCSSPLPSPIPKPCLLMSWMNVSFGNFSRSSLGYYGNPKLVSQPCVPRGALLRKTACWPGLWTMQHLLTSLPGQIILTLVKKPNGVAPLLLWNNLFKILLLSTARFSHQWERKKSDLSMSFLSELSTIWIKDSQWRIRKSILVVL